MFLITVEASIVTGTACENSFIGNHVDNPDGNAFEKRAKILSYGDMCILSNTF
jgi:hypothetical protein